MRRLKDKRDPPEVPKARAGANVEDDDPFLVDPEIYADHAFLVTTSVGNAVDYDHSFGHQVWATTSSKTPRLKKAWFDYTTKIRKTPPLLIAVSYPPGDAGTKYIHGLMVVTGPGEKSNREVAIWREKKWDSWEFPVAWIIHCPDHKNLKRTTYDLSSKTDVTEIPRGLAALTIQELKLYLGRENNRYLRKYCGQYIYKRVEEIFSEDAAAARPKKQRPAVSIEYETTPPAPKPKAEPLPPVPPMAEGVSVEMGSLVNIEEVFGRAPPTPAYWDPALNDLNFQVIDVDYCDLPSMNHGELVMEHYSSPVAPVLRLFGATKEGHSVVAQVRCFSPYLYVRTPEEIVDMLEYTKYDGEVKAQLDQEAKRFFDKEDDYDPSTLLGKIAAQPAAVGACEEFARSLSNALTANLTWAEKKRYGYIAFDGEPITATRPVLKVTLVRREGLIGYRPHLDWFLKIAVVSPHFVKPARKLLEGGTFMWFEPDRNGPGVRPKKYQVYEANIPFALRFMIDTKIAGCCWVTLRRNHYTRWDCSERERATYADIEVLCRDTDVVAQSLDDPAWTDHAPVRSLTLDIVRDSVSPPPHTDCRLRSATEETAASPCQTSMMGTR